MTTQEFKIYRRDITDNKVTIVSKQGEPFDRRSKIARYLSLGYKVYDMSDIEIKSI